MEVRQHLSIVNGISFLLVFICRCAYGCNGVISENHCFVVVYVENSKFVTWNEANTLENGHRLASITSQKQLDAILEYIIEEKYINVWFYIGLSRKANTNRGLLNNWTWTSGIALEYDNWAGGEPNVVNDDCAGVVMRIKDKSQKKTFHDFKCGQKIYDFGLNYIYQYPNNCEEDTVKIGNLSYHFIATPSGSTANSSEVCPSNTPNGKKAKLLLSK
ncbi:uncharacterized protein LOC117121541 [Anneissia japonica]|uniref:uncharacterized protein LOC117121541 n=1 Tax=Anneissia japonica TaxID=1529436 RepID=UPI001425AB88|nr:uncharacterized protein LOC117121541 [Anneissia japonica]